MSEKKHLTVLWTSSDPITADKMVFMYTINSMAHDWWDQITLVIWGGSAKLVSENKDIQQRVKDAQDAGIYVTACKGCSDQLGVSDQLESLGVDVQYLGVALTNLLKGDEVLLTI